MKKILVELNQTCNLNCEYCFYRDYSRNKEMLNLNDIKNIISTNPNLEKVFLTGGEATINSHFKEIIEEFKKNDIKVVVFTNAIKFNNAENLDSYINLVEKFLVTYDHYKDYYKYRMNLDATLNVIKKIVSYNCDKLVVKVCINKQNIDDLDDIFHFLVNLGVKYFSINFIRNIESSNIDFELSLSELAKVFEIIDKYIGYFNSKYIGYLKRFFFNNDMSIELSCLAGDKFKFINCKGEEYICPANFKKKGGCLSKECICIWEMFYEK